MKLPCGDPIRNRRLYRCRNPRTVVQRVQRRRRNYIRTRAAHGLAAGVPELRASAGEWRVLRVGHPRRNCLQMTEGDGRYFSAAPETSLCNRGRSRPSTRVAVIGDEQCQARARRHIRSPTSRSPARRRSGPRLHAAAPAAWRSAGSSTPIRGGWRQPFTRPIGRRRRPGSSSR